MASPSALFFRRSFKRPPMTSPALDDVVLFTGRGGSGTRLLSQLAEELGIFIGNKVNRSGDSVEWVEPVYRMAIESATSIELPSGSRYRTTLREKAAQILDAAAQRVSQR